MKSNKKSLSNGFLLTRLDFLRYLISKHFGSVTQLIDHEPVLLFLIGTLYAWIIYFFAIYQIELLPMAIRAMLLSFLVIITSVSMVFLPSSTRCFFTLIVFNFFASAGKIFLTSIVIKSILDGPVNNTMANIQQMMLSVKCQTSMVKSVGNSMNKKGFSSDNRVFQEIRYFILLLWSIYYLFWV